MESLNRLAGLLTLSFITLTLLLLVKPTLQQQPPPLRSRAEFDALRRLRSSLGLRAKEWPIKSDPCTSWSGLTCVNGVVTAINISAFHRTRRGAKNPQFAVDALANLTQLHIFNASYFLLPGQIPDWFGQSMSNLQILDLTSCSIIGTIPETLTSLTTLTTLILSSNNLSGKIPPGLGQLPNLSILDLSRNSLTGDIPSSFASPSNLTVLDISSNYFSGPIPPAVGLLSNLQILNFSNNRLSASVPSQLGDLSNLVDLDLSSNSLTNSLPPDLTGMKSLKRLLVANNGISGELPDGLFQSLNQLEFLDFSGNNFSGSVPSVLWTSMSSLKVVDVSGNSFTGTLPDDTSLGSTGLLFNLSNNLYYGRLTPVIQRFSLVDISGNYFEGMVPLTAAGSSNISLAANCLQKITGQRTFEECNSFYNSMGLVFENFGDGNTSSGSPVPLSPKKSHKKRNIIILTSVLGGVGVLLLLLLLLLLICCLCRRRNRNSSPRSRSVGAMPTIPVATPQSPGVTINFTSLGEAYTKQQLLQATDNFSDSNLIKNGHSGDLYRGQLTEGGIPVVVKKVDLNKVRRDGYLLELDFFSKVAHPRLVPLLGHCLENEDEKYIVYKGMPNGDLSSSLYRKVDVEDSGLQSLDWITRLKIAIGAAEGLCYLHHECTPPFVHRDMQASSILLDDKFEVRLGSLGEVGVQEGEAQQQSMITRFLRRSQTPERAQSGSQSPTCAQDVYSFGKVLLELVTGKLGISSSTNSTTTKEYLDQILPNITIHDKDLITKIVDPSLIVDEDLLEEVWAMAIVARSCLNPRASRRPLMRYVLKALENPLKVVREEQHIGGSARLRTNTSSRGSWNASTVFGSWRNSTSDMPPGGVLAGSLSRRFADGGGGGTGSLKQSVTTSESQGSGGRGIGSMSRRRHSSREIFPEPIYDVERRGAGEST